MSDWLAGLHRDVRDAARKLLADGWEYDRTSSKNHPRLIWPTTGDRVSLPSTPSDYRSVLNAAATARRLSGVRNEAHRSPRFSNIKGSGFDIDAAMRDSARRRREAAALSERIAHLTLQIAATDIRRDRNTALRLARERIQLTTDLQALGAEAPPLPSDSEDVA